MESSCEKEQLCEKKSQSVQIQSKSQQMKFQFDTYQVHCGTQCSLTYRKRTIDCVQKIEKIQGCTKDQSEEINGLIFAYWSRLSRDYKTSKRIHISRDHKILYFMSFLQDGGGMSYKSDQMFWCSPDLQQLVQEGIQYWLQESTQNVDEQQIQRVQRQLRKCRSVELDGLYSQPGTLCMQKVLLHKVAKLKVAQVQKKEEIQHNSKEEKIQVTQEIKKKRKLNQG